MFTALLASCVKPLAEGDDARPQQAAAAAPQRAGSGGDGKQEGGSEEAAPGSLYRLPPSPRNSLPQSVRLLPRVGLSLAALLNFQACHARDSVSVPGAPHKKPFVQLTTEEVVNALVLTETGAASASGAATYADLLRVRRLRPCLLAARLLVEERTSALLQHAAPRNLTRPARRALPPRCMRCVGWPSLVLA